jgi:hypothetical protein
VPAVLAAALGLLISTAGCRSAWSHHDESLYVAMKDATPAAIQTHAELLREIIENAERGAARPPAGVCAEYAFYLAKLGRIEEANAYLEKEATHYPEARTFLVALGRFLPAVSPVAGGTGAGEEER